MAKKKKKIIKFRHKVFFTILYPVIYLFSKIKYRIKIEKFKGRKDRNYLILYNHQTFGDQFFIPLIVKLKKTYFVASEDICSNGFISKILNYVFAPIPMDKTSVGTAAVMRCLNVVKNGGSIILAPEGNRTYSGKTEYIKPSIVKLIKALKIPVMTVRIEGGYGVQPRWTDKVRKGDIKAYVKNVFEYENYSKYSDEEFFTLLKEDLYVNEAFASGPYKSKKRAEYLERVAYTCPYCGFTKWHSEGNYSTCQTCGKKIEYQVDKTIKGVGFDFPFTFINDWYEYQNDFVRGQDFAKLTETPVFTDVVKLFRVRLYKSKIRISKNCISSLYGDRIVLDYNGIREELFFTDIRGMACMGRNKLSIKLQDKIYQFKVDKHFNALKYLNFYYKSKSIIEEGQDGIFLGL